MTSDKKKNIRLQAGMAIASFSMGSLIALVCLFIVEPIGEIHNTAIYIVSEMLLLCGAILGVDCAFSAKLEKFRKELTDGKD